MVVLDPCRVDDVWKAQDFEDIRIYQNKQTKATLQYGVDFPNYATIIPSYGKTMNELNATGEWDEVPVPVPPGLSYNSIARTTLNSIGGEVAGVAVAVRTGYGDGVYPVFVRRNEDGRVMRMMVDFSTSEDDAITLGIIDSQS